MTDKQNIINENCKICESKMLDDFQEADFCLNWENLHLALYSVLRKG